MRCPSCSHDNRAEHRFCAECGGPLRPSADARGAARDELGARMAAASTGRDLHPADASGERRQLTVLFCDLVGSPALAQQLDPEDWCDVAAEYQATARTVVERFGGYVAK